MKHFLIIMFIGLCFYACKKDKAFSTQSTINVVNAAVDLGAAKINYIGSQLIYKDYTDSINYGAGKLYSIPTGDKMIKLVRSRDSSLIKEGNFQLNAGDIYSMYIIGQFPTVDTLYRKEQLPALYADSLIGIRFINLSPNSVPLAINRKDSSFKEVTNLSYKSISEFKTYPAKATNGSYVFEVRKASDNSLLFTYTLSVTATKRFRNVMVVIKGLSGISTGTNALGGFEVNYF